MKVSELLSAPTLTSSRTLTVFSATVLVVLWTDTDPTKLPLLRGLNLDNVLVYWLLLIILGFMSVAHLVNWINDAVANKRARLEEISDIHMRNKERQQNVTTWLDETVIHDEKPITRRQMHAEKKITRDAQPHIFAAIETENANRSSRRLNSIIQFGLHIAVPGVLAIPAAIWLFNKLC